MANWAVIATVARLHLASRQDGLCSMRGSDRSFCYFLFEAEEKIKQRRRELCSRRLLCFMYFFAAILLDRATKDCIVTKHLFNTKELVVFADAVCPGCGTGFDLAGIGRNSDIGNGRVLGLT